MPKPCSVCVHREHQAIDRAMISGTALTHLAKRFSIPETNLRRHREHMERVLARSERARAEDLMGHLLHLRDEAKRLQASAEAKGDVRTALAALRELTRLAELQARVAGDLKGSQTNVLNVSIVDDATAKRIAMTFMNRRKEIAADAG